MKRLFITTAIPYVNAKPHIGFALEVIQTDAAARYWREKIGPDDTMFLTGSDENSLKNVLAAEKAGQDVATFVEQRADEFANLKELLNLSNDDFIRTREQRHILGAQKLWQACDPDDIFTKKYKGLYCVGCEAFYTQKDCPDGVCPEHKTALEVIEEENYFFKLSKYQKQLEELIESDTLKILPKGRKNEVLSFIRQGLEDFSISRSRERAKDWGVSVPGDDSQVMYVWFDALSNYINALGYAKNGKNYKKFWDNKASKRVHMIGKGILRFHAVYWPAMLLSAKLKLPDEIFVHGYVTVEGEKISKSLGNTIDPVDVVNEYGVDAVRYYFLREIPSDNDGDFSKARIEERYAELANQLGNLVSRVATMANKYFDGVLDHPKLDFETEYNQLQSSMEKFEFKQYLDLIFEVVGRANEMIDKEAPFKLVKTDPDRAREVLSNVAEMIRFIGKSLLPIMPAAAEEILKRYEGDKILIGESLFPRRDQ